MALAIDDPVWAGDDDDDARIVRLAASPGGDALDLLYRCYADRVRRLCRSRLGDDADAEDACHEALLRAHHALPRFRAGAPMWPWLATIAGNACIDMHRSRRCESLDGRDIDHRELGADDSTDPHTVVVGRLRHQLVDDALDALPERYRSTVYLRDLAGWSYADIAEVDGCTVATVRGTLHRGRSALRECVRTLAAGRGMWPLPAVMPAFLSPWSWLKRGAAARPARLRPVFELCNTLGPAGANMAAGVAVAVAMVGAMAFPIEGSEPEGAMVSAAHHSPAGETEPLPPATDRSGSDLPAGGAELESDAGAARGPAGDAAPTSPMAAPADASIGFDQTVVVTVSGSIAADNDAPDEEGHPDAENHTSVGCGMSDVQRAACNHLDHALGGSEG